MKRALYVLKCQDGYWYIGESSEEFSNSFQLTSLEIRIKQQFGEKIGRCKQSDFCKLHQPIKVEKTISLGLMSYKEAEIMENALTKIYVEKYGAYKVIGGIACLDRDEKASLSSNTKDEILKMTQIK